MLSTTSLTISVGDSRVNLADRQSDVVERMSERLLAWRKTLPDGPADATAGKNDYPWPKPKE